MTDGPNPAPRDLRRDLLALGLAVGGLAAVVGSCVTGGWPVILIWLALILIAGAAAVGLREPAEPHRPDGRAPADDENALQIVPERGPDTT